jgi:hypothetical protein
VNVAEALVAAPTENMKWTQLYINSTALDRAGVWLTRELNSRAWAGIQYVGSGGSFLSRTQLSLNSACHELFFACVGFHLLRRLLLKRAGHNHRIIPQFNLLLENGLADALTTAKGLPAPQRRQRCA